MNPPSPKTKATTRSVRSLSHLFLLTDTPLGCTLRKMFMAFQAPLPTSSFRVQELICALASPWGPPLHLDGPPIYPSEPICGPLLPLGQIAAILGSTYLVFALAMGLGKASMHTTRHWSAGNFLRA